MTRYKVEVRKDHNNAAGAEVTSLAGVPSGPAVAPLERKVTGFVDGSIHWVQATRDADAAPLSETPLHTKRELFERVVKELSLDVRDPFTLLLANACALTDQVDELKRSLAQAIRERGEARRDAERYRWIRAHYIPSANFKLEWYLPRLVKLDADGLDTAIDADIERAAMSTTPGRG